MRLQASVAKATAVGNPGEYRVTSRPVCRTPKTRTPPFPSASRTLPHQPQIEAFWLTCKYIEVLSAAAIVKALFGVGFLFQP